MGAWTWFADAGLFVVGAVGIVIAAMVAELGGPVARWLAERNGFVDREQSPLVRRVAVRLGSRRQKERLQAVDLLRDLGDASAVPALIRAIQRYRDDPRLLESIVIALDALGDPRAVPAIRPLSHGRNQSLMAAARNALATLQPGGSLLRPAEGGRDLLRPVIGRSNETTSLLRPQDFR